MSLNWLLVFVLFPTLVFASENCVAQFNGVCRDVCAAGEEPAEGAFIDCTEKQECCVATAVQPEKRLVGGDDANKALEKKKARPQ